MAAQEYFERIRENVIEIERSKGMLDVLMQSEDVSAQSYDCRTSGGEVDAMDKVDRRIDFESRLKERIGELEGELDDATDVLYGKSGRGGLAKLKGNRYADVLCMAYLQAMTWHETADVMRCSQKWCRELASAAFVFVDEFGLSKLREI